MSKEKSPPLDKLSLLCKDSNIPICDKEVRVSFTYTVFLKNTLVCFIGDSQSGKSRLMMELEKRSDFLIRIVRSTTTRHRRENETEYVYRKFYRHASKDFFQKSIAAGHFVEYDEYAGNLYGTSHNALEHTLSISHAMLAVTEKTVPHLQSLGLNVVSIQIIGVNAPGSDDPLRQKADAERRGSITPDYVIFNDFAPGGFEKACAELLHIIKPYIAEI
ncbi:hypothetical protein HYW94_01150 [Candidatus Uhrbacteria bacterium]|nr:hypothetical protein [Candidatus Uhrbacteria bacterium]